MLYRIFPMAFSVLLLFYHLAVAAEYEAPEKEFLNATVLIRSGIDDLGNVTVSEFVRLIQNSVMDNGGSPEVKGWIKTSQGYSLDLVGLKAYTLDFLWAGGENTLLQPVQMGQHTIPPMLYVTVIVGSQSRSSE